jgi:RNA recognition motif-containing protein
LPDNSYAQTNLCVTSLDLALTAEDLHRLFDTFGEIKSCKVATDPLSGQSKGYGFVWFKNEASCKSALNCKDAPYPTQLYQSICLRKIEAMSVPDKPINLSLAKRVTMAGFPRNFT